MALSDRPADAPAGLVTRLMTQIGIGRTAPPEIVIVGFPKCGSTALIKALEGDADVASLHGADGGFEVPWPEIKRARVAAAPEQIVAHKCVSYAFKRKALAYLERRNPRGIAVLCIRDPKQALISWHNMHRSIARRGKNKSHFAWRDRAFFLAADHDLYFRRFARKKMNYHKHFKTLAETFPKDRIVVVSQERMAADIRSVADYVKAVARGGDPRLAPPPENARAHRSYAESNPAILDERIAARLDLVSRKLHKNIARSGVRTCL